MSVRGDGGFCYDMFVGRLLSFVAAFHLVVSIGELVASVDLVDYEHRS